MTALILLAIAEMYASRNTSPPDARKKEKRFVLAAFVFSLLDLGIYLAPRIQGWLS